MGAKHPHHPIIGKWLANRAYARELFRKGRAPYTHCFGTLDYSQFRILSKIFFEVEKHGVVPKSPEWPTILFEHQQSLTVAYIGPVNEDAGHPKAELRFVVFETTPEANVFAEWSGDHDALMNSVPAIVSAVLAATRATALRRREHIRSLCAAGIADLQKTMRDLDNFAANGFAARCDPRTIEALHAMAERHQAATLIRSFLRSLSDAISDGTVLVAGYTLDEWMTWAAVKTEEFDPLVLGPQRVFETLVKSDPLMAGVAKIKP